MFKGFWMNFDIVFLMDSSSDDDLTVFIYCLFFVIMALNKLLLFPYFLNLYFVFACLCASYDYTGMYSKLSCRA